MVQEKWSERLIRGIDPIMGGEKMKSILQTASILCLSSVLLSGSSALCQENQEKKEASLRPYTLRVTAVLVNKEGAPQKTRKVYAYPVTAENQALLAFTMPPGYVYKLWNPMIETDSSGKFVFEMPLVTRIDNKPIGEIVIGVKAPGGGLSVRSETGIESVNPNLKAEACLTREVAIKELSLLRQGTEMVKVKIGTQSKEVDLGKIVID
jgi:hypothetical protein